MLDIPSITGIVAAAGVIVGVFFTVLELRNLLKTRQTDLVMRLYSTFLSNEFQERYLELLNLKFKNYDDYVKKYGLSGVTKISVFFEGIGILLHRKIVDIDFVAQLFRQSVELMWERIKPIMEGARQRYNQPKWAEYFEYLYNEMQRREQIVQQMQQ